MKSLSSVGLGLSIVFGCLLLALVAELYYLLWWKKRFTRPGFQNEYFKPATRELLFMPCCKNPSSSSSSSAVNPKITQTHVQESHPGNNEDLLLQPFGVHHDIDCVNVGPGLMPRFLFTIIEETKEDLESEDGLSVKGKCLSDWFLNMENRATPYLTPLASPSMFAPVTPLTESPYHNSKKKKEALYSFFDSSADAEFNRIIRSSPSTATTSLSSASPPPRFKFLRDAEEKLYRSKLMEMEEAERFTDKGVVQEIGKVKSFASESSFDKDNQDIGSFVKVVVDGNTEKGFGFQNQQQQEAIQFQSSTSSQVLPLASSPLTSRPQPWKSWFKPILY